MNSQHFVKSCIAIIAVATVGMVSGCANMEVNTGRGNVPGHYIRYEMQEADRAVEAARSAGKDKICPVEFKAAEDAKNHAYDVYRSCRTEEGSALAKQATAKANALCPPQKVEAVLSIDPASIKKGESAKLAWSSKNADECVIAPAVGKVEPQGSTTVTPAENTGYTLTCTGPGGKADSAASITVIAPAPVVAVAQPKAAPVKSCEPMEIDIEFDTNKSVIKPKYHAELKKLAELLIEFPNEPIVIKGHTDNVGSKAYNMKLSKQRAESVRSYLIKHFNIAPNRITAEGFGMTKPIATNKTKAGREKNRRIESHFTCGK